jgi:hypothetical protein
MALTGHASHSQRCPLLGVKRTSAGHASMSAYDPKRTSPNSDKTTSTILRCGHNERADGCLILGKSGRRLDGAERLF